MSDPIPYWRDDPDYFPTRDERRRAHIAEIRRRRRIDGMVAASAADGSYAIVVAKE